ncbi:MAG: hypothetical protein JW928_03330 [Candidatus Aureabacteria bacterium]|nr:hypothetical protein [Candidatus Auribacterota bacterium]
MTKSGLILAYKIRQGIRKTFDLRKEPLLKQLVITVFIVSYLTGGFFLLYKFFGFVNSLAPVGAIVLDRLFYVYFFILFIMLIVSALIIGYSSFFKIKETEFLFTLPVENRHLWLYNFLKIVFMSSWAFIFLSMPVILAFGMVKNAAPSYYILTMVSLFPFLLITSCLGCLILFAFLKIVPKMYAKYVLAAILTFMIYTILRTIPQGTYYESTNVIFIINTLLRHTDVTLNNFLPSTWMSRQLLMSLDREYSGYLFFLLLSVSQGFFLLMNLCWASSLVYHDLYTKEKSHSVRKRYTTSRARFFYRRLLVRLLPRKYSAIIIKDFISFVRDPLQWTQFLVFFGLIFLYIINLRNMRYDLDDPFWKNLITFFNLGAVCLTLATLNTRFIFPLISVEGQRIWILGMIPGRRKEIISIKYVYTAVLSMIIIIPLTLLSNYIIRSSPWIYVLSLSTGILVALTLSALSVGLGALYPDFNAESPSEIVSGFGGTLVLVLSIMYIIVIIGIEGYIGHVLVVLRPSAGVKWILFGVALFSILASSFLASLISIKAGSRHLERLDF